MTENSRSVTNKLVQVVLNLARRSIDEARKVPYVVEQDNVVDILLNHPDLYQQLVSDGQLEGEGLPQGRVLVKVDILAEIEEFTPLDRLLLDNWSSDNVDLESVTAQVNSMTKLFLAYHSNMVATFEREYDQFLERYWKTLEGAEERFSPLPLYPSDLEEVRRTAEGFLAEKRYIEAFSLGKLFHPEIVRDFLFQFPGPDYSLTQELIQSSPKNGPAYSNLVRFILRACYLSHNLWSDLFSTLLKLADSEPGLYHRPHVVELIEQDLVFCCNLLHTTYDQLHALPADERRAAIETSLRAVWRAS